MAEKISYAQRNKNVLASFVAYCEAHPEQRFWQALRNWANAGSFIFAGDAYELLDTFYWEGRNGDE